MDYQLSDGLVEAIRRRALTADEAWWHFANGLLALERREIPRILAEHDGRVSERQAVTLFRTEAAKAAGCTRQKLNDDMRIARNTDPELRAEFPLVTKTIWRHVINMGMEKKLAVLDQAQAGHSVAAIMERYARRPEVNWQRVVRFLAKLEPRIEQLDLSPPSRLTESKLTKYLRWRACWWAWLVEEAEG